MLNADLVFPLNFIVFSGIIENPIFPEKPKIL